MIVTNSNPALYITEPVIDDDDIVIKIEKTPIIAQKVNVEQDHDGEDLTLTQPITFDELFSKPY